MAQLLGVQVLCNSQEGRVNIAGGGSEEIVRCGEQIWVYTGILLNPYLTLLEEGALDGKRVGYGGTGNGKMEEKLERSMR